MARGIVAVALADARARWSANRAARITSAEQAAMMIEERRLRAHAERTLQRALERIRHRAGVAGSRRGEQTYGSDLAGASVVSLTSWRSHQLVLENLFRVRGCGGPAVDPVERSRLNCGDVSHRTSRRAVPPFLLLSRRSADTRSRCASGWRGQVLARSDDRSCRGCRFIAKAGRRRGSGGPTTRAGGT